MRQKSKSIHSLEEFLKYTKEMKLSVNSKENTWGVKKSGNLLCMHIPIIDF